MLKRMFAEKVILGAGFFGISLLVNSNKKSCLIERGMRIGDEFCAALRVNRYNKQPETKIGKALLETLTKDSFIKDGYICSAPAAFWIAREAREKNILFKTEVYSIEKTDGGYSVKIFNSDGYSEIITPLVIDTTSEGIFRTEKTQRCLNAFTIGTTPVFDVFTEHYIMSFKADEGEELINTRKRLYEHVQRNVDIGILYTADVFSYTPKDNKKRISDGYFWIPSSGFSNILEAVDSGGEEKFEKYL